MQKGMLEGLGALALAAGALALAAAGCGSDDGTGASGPGSSSSATTGAGGAGGAGTTTSSSTTSSSSTGCTMGGDPGCPCPSDVCPAPLATGIASVVELRQSATDLYWLASIDRLAKTGGAPATAVSGVVSAYAVDDTGLYWLDGTGTALRKAALDGSGEVQLGAADGLMHPKFVALDATDVYFARVTTQGTGSCVGIERIPKAGGPVVHVAEACEPTKSIVPYGIVVDDTNVYWLTVVVPAFAEGKLFFADKTAQGATGGLLASTNGPMSRPKLVGTSLYLIAGGAVNVVDAVAGGAPNKVSGTTDVKAFDVDANGLVAIGDDGLFAIDAGTETATLLAYERGSEVVMDADTIRWASGSSGSVSVLALPR